MKTVTMENTHNSNGGLRQKQTSPIEPLAELNRIRIHENGEPLVDLRQAVKGIGTWEVPGPVSPGRFRYHARATVAAMLQKAQSALPKGHRLLVMSAYRSLESQIALYTRVQNDLKQINPHWPRNILVRQTNRWVHPPHAKTPPGHSTGGAVDLVIGGPDGKPMDFTSPYAFSYEDDIDRFSPTFSKYVSDRARQNRALLIHIMSAVGFTNYTGEFWHWSYGDSCWAWRLGRKTAVYGAAPQPT